jgi:hypothetical protein
MRSRTSFPSTTCVAGVALALLFVGCSERPQRTAADVRADIARQIPAGIPDRTGWANDLYAAFDTQDIDPSASNICAAIAVIEQESTFRADPPVAGLPQIARAEIDRRAALLHVPRFVVDAALAIHAPDGRSYSEHLAGVHTEHQLSDLFEQMIGAVPMGRRLLAGLNPVHTAGPMQVSVAFAQAHARGYPYPPEGSIRHEVFSRRGGLYFGVQHLLGYPAHYPRMLYRFADFNAGQYASRNAAFQRAASVASGIMLAQDGDLIRPGATLDAPGPTEAVLRRLQPPLPMDAAGIRRDLQRSDSLAFEDTALHGDVYAVAEARAKGPLTHARVPDITLHGPKLTRKLTTAWYAARVDARYDRCLRGK